MTVAIRQEIERRIVSRIVKDALAQGYIVSVYDGCDFAIKRSSHYSAIMAAIMSTDEDTLIIRDANTGEKIGFIHLVYGNDGFDVVSDYTANDRIEALLQGANTLADKLSA